MGQGRPLMDALTPSSAPFRQWARNSGVQRGELSLLPAPSITGRKAAPPPSLPERLGLLSPAQVGLGEGRGLLLGAECWSRGGGAVCCHGLPLTPAARGLSPHPLSVLQAVTLALSPRQDDPPARIASIRMTLGHCFPGTT